jgi:hypothetical protein
MWDVLVSEEALSINVAFDKLQYSDNLVGVACDKVLLQKATYKRAS